jgi:hypothetical protein
LEPEKILTRETLNEPHRTYATPDERENNEIRLLGVALRDQIEKELLINRISRTHGSNR